MRVWYPPRKDNNVIVTNTATSDSQRPCRHRRGHIISIPLLRLKWKIEGQDAASSPSLACLYNDVFESIYRALVAVQLIYASVLLYDVRYLYQNIIPPKNTRLWSMHQGHDAVFCPIDHRVYQHDQGSWRCSSSLSVKPDFTACTCYLLIIDSLIASKPPFTAEQMQQKLDIWPYAANVCVVHFRHQVDPNEDKTMVEVCVQVSIWL